MSDDPAITAAIQSGIVPPSISAEYLAESRDRPARRAIIFVGALTIVVVLLRFISRLSVSRLGLDDALAAFSLLLQIAFIALARFLMKIGTGRHLEYIEYVLTPSQTEKSEVLDFAAHLIYTTALFVCRLSGLAFYRRLCKLHDRLLLAIKCALLVHIAAYLPQMFLIIFHCKPVTGLWPYSWEVGSADNVCLSWGLVYAVNSGLSLLCDILMFAIPVGLICTISLPLSGKLRLYLILLPGVLVIIISCVRVYLVVEGGWYSDSSWAYDPMLAVENAEIGGTLIALSIPGLKPLVNRAFSKLDGLRHSNPPNLIARSPSAIFASDTSKNIVAVDAREVLQNRMSRSGLGAADNRRIEVDVDTTNMIYVVPTRTSSRESLGWSLGRAI